jgi:hypothetical protein
MRIVSLRELVVGVTLCELREPLRRAGQEFGHHGVDLPQIAPPGQRV